MRILIIALSGIGDALMFTPALKLLKQNNPNLVIDALVMYNGAKEIYSTNSNINKIYYFNFLKEGKLKSLRFVFSLRKKYDASINVYPSNRKEYNIISFLIGAKHRAAIKYLRSSKTNLDFLNNLFVPESDSLHNVKTNIKLAEALMGKKFNDEPKLEINLKDDDLKYAQGFYNSNNIYEDDLVIGFHPGCATLKNHIKRRWEAEKFSALANLLIEQHKANILIFGGPDENELKCEIQNKINSLNAFVINADTILKTTSLMKRCNVFVTNDSSQMHIASALGLNTVAIIGPTNKHFIHPWKTEHKIVSLNLECAPCFFYSPKPLLCNRTDVKFKCIKELSVEMVFESVKSYVKF